jgi:hypothetical protein
MGWLTKESGFDSRHGKEIFLFTTTSRLALGPTQPPIQWILVVLSLGYIGQGVKLTTHLHLALSLRMVKLYHHFPIYLLGIVLN